MSLLGSLRHGWAVAGALLLTTCSSNGDGSTGDSCSVDSDCMSSLVCSGPNDFGGCGIPPREGCASDGECGSGSFCHTVPDGCSADGIGSECRAACTATSCGDGFRCSAAGACETVPCDEGSSCPDRQRCDSVAAHATGPVHARTNGCVDIACTRSADCPTNKPCVNGACQDSSGTCRAVQIVP